MDGGAAGPVKKTARPSRPRHTPPPETAELLAAALRAQGEGIFIARRRLLEGGLRITFANEQFCAMTGYTADELVGRAHGFLHVERADRERLARWLRAARPASALTGESYLIRKDGTTSYAAWSFSTMGKGRGRPTHVVASYRDMTEKRSLQEALVHAQRLDAVGRLAGGVAHDFNNLISVINGYCEMLSAQVAGMPRALHEVTEIHKAGRKAATLTRQLLAFGRRQPMDARVISLNQVIHENTEIMERLLGSTGRLVLNLAPDAGNVRTDPAQFQQVLLNLTINARDALREDGCVTISTASRTVPTGRNRRFSDTPPGRYVVLTVNDNGTGMDGETQRHLFEPFFTTKPEGQGTGLGLALVYGVVQQSGGYISVRSELGAGSTFVILLPEHRGPADTNSHAPFAKLPPLPATRGHETVLLVEEDEVLRKMVAGILTADGYQVIETKRHKEALAKVRRQASRVELLIISLTGEGEKLARSLHRTQRALRILNLCSQSTQPAPSWLAPAQLCSLPKPFALSELLRAARTLLDA